MLHWLWMYLVAFKDIDKGAELTGRRCEVPGWRHRLQGFPKPEGKNRRL